MKTGHHPIRTVVAGLLMSAALMAGTASVAPAADAGPRPEVRERAKQKKKPAPRQKREVKPRRDKKAPARDNAARKNDVRRDDGRRNDARRDDARAPRVRRDDRRSSGGHGRAVAPPRSSRRSDARRHAVTPRRHTRGHRGGDHWYRHSERRRDGVYYVPQRWFPRYARLPRFHVAPRHGRPWYARAARIYIQDDPFYFHVGLGLYIGGLAVQFDLRNEPPRGYVYYDPYCDEVFWSLAEYRLHIRWYDHPAVVTLIEAETCRY